jgi:SAM-dependent methyltransferase
VSHAQEHLGNEPSSELWGEHRARYRFAAQFAPDKRVLDVACGAGFGLTMLRAAGACAVGMDLDADALREARSLAGPCLARTDATNLPLAAHSMDVVTSFETLEHVADAAGLIHEVRRVLGPGGVLVLSTPNRAFGPPELHTGNPFHIREFTAGELHDLLAECFASVRIYGQWPAPSYRFVPFRMVDPDWSPGAVTWKVLNRLPFGIKNTLAQKLSGRPWYPAETHYRFEEGRADGAHALLAVDT